MNTATQTQPPTGPTREHGYIVLTRWSRTHLERYAHATPAWGVASDSNNNDQDVFPTKEEAEAFATKYKEQWDPTEVDIALAYIEILP